MSKAQAESKVRFPLHLLTGHTISKITRGKHSQCEWLEFRNQVGAVIFEVHQDNLFDVDGFNFDLSEIE